MNRRTTVAWCLRGALILAACQTTAPAQPAKPTAATPTTPAPPTPAQPVPSDTPSSPVPSDTPDSPVPSDTPSDPTAAPDHAVSYTQGPLRAAAVPDGVLVVWSRHADADKSEILAVLLDAEGRVRGAPRLVRRTSGVLLDLEVHHNNGSAWIAWVAQLAELPRPRALVAAMWLAPDLSAVRPPATLGQFSDESISAWPERDMLRLLALADGSAAVASAGPPAECADIVTDRKTKCPGFDLSWVAQDGTITRAGRGGADGGDPGVASLVDTGAGVLLDTWAWHGGATTARLYAAYGQPLADPPLRLLDCHPPFARGFTGDALVTLCPSEYPDEGERCPVLDPDDDDERCMRIDVVRLDGTPVTPKRAPPRLTTVTTRKLRCVAGRPLVELGWKGGSVRLDPHAPGASLALPELGVWTGRHAIKIAADGTRERWSCDKARFTLAEALTDSFPLDAQASILRPIPAPP